MIKSFLITNEKKESLLLELTEPQKHNIVIKRVTGLGPEKAEINTTDVANSDISIFNTARRDIRNIVFYFGFYQNKGIESDRMASIYKYFPLKSKVRIQCNTDVKKLWIEGYVEKDEPNIFSKDEEVVVSILCPDGLWRGDKAANYVLSGLSKFEFPFSNECTSYSFYATWADAEAFTWDVVGPGFFYTKTRDTSIVSGKTYYTRSGEEGSYIYTPVTNPIPADLQNYYDQNQGYGWTWDKAGETIGKVSSLVKRYKNLLLEQPINKDKVNTLVEEIYKIDYNNYSHVYPIN